MAGNRPGAEPDITHAGGGHGKESRGLRHLGPGDLPTRRHVSEHELVVREPNGDQGSTPCLVATMIT